MIYIHVLPNLTNNVWFYYSAADVSREILGLVDGKYKNRRHILKMNKYKAADT
jgi:hypothetical protein